MQTWCCRYFQRGTGDQCVCVVVFVVCVVVFVGCVVVVVVVVL